MNNIKGFLVVLLLCFHHEEQKGIPTGCEDSKRILQRQYIATLWQNKTCQYAKKHDLPILENVVLPRVGAMNVVLDTVGNAEPPNGIVSENFPGSGCVKWVIDVTVAYPNGRPLDMHGMLIGYWPPCQTIVHYRAYPVAEIPKDIDGRTKWLYDRYQEKEEMLDSYYKSHKFLDESDEKIRELPRMSRKVLQLDKISIIISYIFYTLSAYLLWIYIYCPLWGLLSSVLGYLFSIF